MIYEYKGLTAGGREASGMIDAENAKAARIRLKTQGIFPTEVHEGSAENEVKPEEGALESSFSRRLFDNISRQEIALMTRQMSTLIAAGLSLMEALEALTEQTEKSLLKKMISGIREKIKEGNPLSRALALHPRYFSPLYIQMIRAGEASGTLARMLNRLAEFLEHQSRLRSKIISALAYPVLMVAVSLSVLVAMITFVIPRVVVIFEDMHQALPLPTRLLIGLSDLIRNQGWILLILMGVLFYFFRRFIQTDNGRRRFDGWILRLPVVGGMVKRVSFSRFSKTLETLLAGGVSLLSALDIVKTLVHNKVLEEAIGAVRENVKEGQSIAGPLRRSGLFPPLMIHMIAVGEKSGELELMLGKVAETYDYELEAVVGALTALLSPLLILGMGLVILFIVLSILLPIFQMSSIVR
ncbi:MAG: type II secretion system inner membrane protein GspF [Nitrospirae bacterium]|nr:type II secretion system inner membrane protein GspF [Nitrospirota bacterium]MBI3351385.1 type II secretion system inner membrane protein GspF [Nitrospirota bacterium]